MSKAILVLDMPENCSNCPCLDDCDNCLAVGTSYTDVDVLKEKPEWCPLKPLPEKMQVCGRYPQPDGVTPSYKFGFNACIDVILKNNDLTEV